MGQAKLRAKLAIPPLSREVLVPIVRAARLIVERAGDAEPGMDCVRQAFALRTLLIAAGYDARQEIGVAAWLCGTGNADVIAHHESVTTRSGDGSEGFLGHSWVEVDGYYIVDSTTTDLPTKMAGMNRVDGMNGMCVWHPEFLFARKSMSKTVHEVRQSYTVGVFHYEARPEFRDIIEPYEAARPRLASAKLVASNPGGSVYIINQNAEEA
jgi:hypothetical protein